MQRLSAFIVLALAALVACARPVPNPAPASGERIVASDQNGASIRSTNTAGPISIEVQATPVAAYRALVSVYTQLGFAPETMDEASLRVAKTNLVVRRLLAGQRASAYFDCGQTLTGARADEGRLTVDIASQATSTGSGAVVATVVSAVVRSNDGAASSPTSCISTGLLEARIHDAVKRGS
ncbi:MAG TPA: hypothetical protein VHM67_08870 [Gemmatimonadaceae bacterium]|nr:hypothetical protein [Gemmatimonadaceae bacterium]